MTELAQWQKGNEEYLTAALAWLRLRLALRSSQPGSVDEVIEQEEKAAIEAMVALEKMEPPPSLIIAAQQFGLSQYEREVLLLYAAMELDTSIAAQCAIVQGDPNKTYPTFALALSIFDETAWDALSPERPLRYWRLIEINQPGAQPLTTSPIRADERLVNYIKGLNYLDDRLSSLLVPVRFDA